MSKISFVVPVYNEEKELNKFYEFYDKTTGSLPENRVTKKFYKNFKKSLTDDKPSILYV